MPALIERPKMSLAMWGALKNHIMKQREKRKQEQEADAAEEQLKREQEMKRRQDEMTIEEIKEQVARVAKKLAEKKEEKLKLVVQYKKVLTEDESRRREKENNEIMAMNHAAAAAYPNMGVGHPQPLYMLNNNQLIAASGRSPTVMYKVTPPPPPPQQNLVSSGSLKRQRSPSPPAPYQSFNYKASYPPPSKQAVTYAGTPYYPHTSVSGVTTFPFPVGAQFPDQPPSASKHHPPYHLAPPHIAPQQGYSLPPQMEHPKSNYPDEKYYVPTSSVVRGSPVVQNPSIITIQPQPKKLMMGRIQEPNYPGSLGPKAMHSREPGGITSGYPVRSQPTPTSGSGSSSQNSYVGQPRHGYQGPPPPTTRFY